MNDMRSWDHRNIKYVNDYASMNKYLIVDIIMILNCGCGIVCFDCGHDNCCNAHSGW